MTASLIRPTFPRRAAATATALLLICGVGCLLFGEATPVSNSHSSPAVQNPGAETRIDLWNGTDLAGWKLVLRDPAFDPAAACSVADGLLQLHAGAVGYLRTEASFSNYRLHVEWRWPVDATPKSNSGVLVHLHGEDVVWPACIQVQQRVANAGQLIGMDTGIPGFPVVNNQARAPLLAPPSEVPLGEWNSCDIYAAQDTIEVYVNGVRQNHADHLPVQAGTIGLQLEGAAVAFRNLWLSPL